MFVDLLLKPVSGLGPNARFFLAAFAMRFGGEGAVLLTVKELARRLMISSRLVMQVVPELARGEAFLVVKDVSVGRGRPTRSYEIAPALQEVERSRPESIASLTHDPLIRHLLSCPDIQESDSIVEVAAGESDQAVGYKQPPSRKKSNRLSVSNRLLLAVLMCHADDLGVVRRVGMPMLKQLTGLDEAKLKPRLRRLVHLGFIRSSVAGVTSSVFAEVKVSTTYFLNLNHPQLRLEEDCCASIVLHEYGVGRRETVSAAAPAVALRFFQALREPVFEVLYLKLARYVSHLLSHHWNELRLPERSWEFAPLKNMISADFNRPQGDFAMGLAIGEADWLEVIDHFHWFVVARAAKIKSRLEGTVLGDLKDSRMEVIPSPDRDDGSRVTTLLLRRGPVPTASCLVIRDTRSGFCEPFNGEAQLAADERYQFGLQTNPKSG
ncbi:hypothetical protein AAHB44_25790 [Pseudomonas simiae]